MISSPLRYPGGKGRLYNVVKQIMQDGNLLTRTYVEPFAGGFAICILLHVDLAVAVNLRAQIVGKGVDTAYAHTVKTAGNLVGALVELAAGV